jgi:hypothetical protein
VLAFEMKVTLYDAKKNIDTQMQRYKEETKQSKRNNWAEGRDKTQGCFQ